VPGTKIGKDIAQSKSIMARANLFRTDIFPYHVINRSNNKEWFYIPDENLWSIFVDKLQSCSETYGAEIHTFVLMSNHFHLLISTPKRNLDAIMCYLQREVCRAIQRECGRVNHIFGGRYRWSVLGNSHAVAYTYKYICRNPVRAGIVDQAWRYPYSSFSQLCNESCEIPISDGLGSLWTAIPKNWEERTAWIDTPTSKELEALISGALRRTHYKFSESNEKQKLIRKLRKEYGVELHCPPSGPGSE